MRKTPRRNSHQEIIPIVFKIFEISLEGASLKINPFTGIFD